MTALSKSTRTKLPIITRTTVNKKKEEFVLQTFPCLYTHVQGELICCSNPRCPSGGVFHVSCIELITEEMPPSDEDWWCSPGCERWSKYCTCKTFTECSSRVECGNSQKCQHGHWFHPKCVGVLTLPGASKYMY